MNRIFIDAEEKYLGAVVVYAHSDNKLYADTAYKKALSNEVVVNLYKKGLMLVEDSDGTVYRPVALKKNLTVYNVTVLNGSDATPAFKVFSSTDTSAAAAAYVLNEEPEMYME